jgi:hypothetical protein
MAKHQTWVAAPSHQHLCSGAEAPKVWAMLLRICPYRDSAVVTGPNQVLAQAGGACGMQPQLESVKPYPRLAANRARPGGLQGIGATSTRGGRGEAAGAAKGHKKAPHECN